MIEDKKKAAENPDDNDNENEEKKPVIVEQVIITKEIPSDKKVLDRDEQKEDDHDTIKEVKVIKYMDLTDKEPEKGKEIVIKEVKEKDEDNNRNNRFTRARLRYRYKKEREKQNEDSAKKVELDEDSIKALDMAKNLENFPIKEISKPEEKQVEEKEIEKKEEKTPFIKISLNYDNENPKDSNITLETNKKKKVLAKFGDN